jgi:hypothetical protein
LFEGKRSAIAALSGVVSLGLCLYCVYWSEPIIDFRPYKIGNDVRDLRKVKAGTQSGNALYIQE